MEDLYNDYLKNLALSQNSKDKLSPTWNEIEERLDKEMPVKKYRRKGLILWFFILLLMFVGAGYYLNISSDLQKKLQENISSSNKEVSKDNTFKLKDDLSSNGNTIKNSSHKRGNINPTSLNKVQSKSYNKITESKETVQIKSNKIIVHKNDAFTISPVSSDLIFDHKPLKIDTVKNEIGLNKNFLSQNTNSYTEVNLNFQQRDKIDSFLTTKDSTTIAQQVELIVDSLVLANDKIKTVKPSLLTSIVKKWEIVPTVSADFLLANINTASFPGFLAGANMHYNINNHWTIKAGLLYNHIKVNSNGDVFYYLPKKDSYTYYYTKVEDIKGFIDALEIPIAVRYTVNPKNRLVLHFSTGLSTVFYLKTDCTFRLLDYNNNYQYWNSKNDPDDEYSNTEWLGNLRLATGCSYLLNNGLRIELEPSYKLPLEEFGHGHSRIGSLSLNLSLRIPIPVK